MLILIDDSTDKRYTMKWDEILEGNLFLALDDDDTPYISVSECDITDVGVGSFILTEMKVPDRVWGETHCPYCEKPLAQDDDYDKYEPGEGQCLCWSYPLYPCMSGISAEDRLIQVLTERDKLKGV